MWWLCTARADGGDRAGGPPPPWRLPLAERQAQAFPRAAGWPRRDGAVPWIDRCPERIVAGSVLSAEVLLAIAPPHRIAAVHYLAADPHYSMVAAAAAGWPVVGAGPEQLLVVRPDLVLTDPFTSAETQRLLDTAGVPVVRTPSVTTLADIVDSIRMIGWVSGCDQAAEHLVDGLQARVGELQRDAEMRCDWRVMNLNGAMETYGKGSLLDAVLDVAGVHNVAAEHGVRAFGVLDVESVLAWRPDALLVAIAPGAPPSMPAWLLQHPGLQHLPCVQQERVILVPHALLGSTSQHVVDLASIIGQQLAAWGRP